MRGNETQSQPIVEILDAQVGIVLAQQPPNPTAIQETRPDEVVGRLGRTGACRAADGFPRSFGRRRLCGRKAGSVSGRPASSMAV